MEPVDDVHGAAADDVEDARRAAAAEDRALVGRRVFGGEFARRDVEGRDGARSAFCESTVDVHAGTHREHAGSRDARVERTRRICASRHPDVLRSLEAREHRGDEQSFVEQRQRERGSRAVGGAVREAVEVHVERSAWTALDDRADRSPRRAAEFANAEACEQRRVVDDEARMARVGEDGVCVLVADEAGDHRRARHQRHAVRAEEQRAFETGRRRAVVDAHDVVACAHREQAGPRRGAWRAHRWIRPHRRAGEVAEVAATSRQGCGEQQREGLEHAMGHGVQKLKRSVMSNLVAGSWLSNAAPGSNRPSTASKVQNPPR